MDTVRTGSGRTRHAQWGKSVKEISERNAFSSLKLSSWLLNCVYNLWKSSAKFIKLILRFYFVSTHSIVLFYLYHRSKCCLSLPLLSLSSFAALSLAPCSSSSAALVCVARNEKRDVCVDWKKAPGLALSTESGQGSAGTLYHPPSFPTPSLAALLIALAEAAQLKRICPRLLLGLCVFPLPSFAFCFCNNFIFNFNY